MNKNVRKDLARVLVGCVAIGFMIGAIVLLFKGENGISGGAFISSTMLCGIFNVIR